MFFGTEENKNIEIDIKESIIDEMSVKYYLNYSILKYMSKELYYSYIDNIKEINSHIDDTVKMHEKFLNIKNRLLRLEEATNKINELIPALEDSEELKEIFININNITNCEKFIKEYEKYLLHIELKNKYDFVDKIINALSD